MRRLDSDIKDEKIVIRLTKHPPNLVVGTVDVNLRSVNNDFFGFRVGAEVGKLTPDT